MTLELGLPPATDGSSSTTAATPAAPMPIRPRHPPDTPWRWCGTRLHPSMLVAPLFVRRDDPVDAGPGAAVARSCRRGGRRSPDGSAEVLFRLPMRGRRRVGRPTTMDRPGRAFRRIAHSRSDVTTPTCLCEYTDHATGRSPLTATSTTWRPSSASPDRSVTSRSGRHRRPERHGRRPGRGGPGSARRPRPRFDADPRLLGEVCVRLLRSVPRGGRQRPRLRRPARLPDGPGQRS